MRIPAAGFLLLVAAGTAAADLPAPSLEAARELLATAAAETDPARARDLARRALPGLLAAREEGKLDCWLTAMTAEAQLRAGDLDGARASIALGSGPQCDAATFAQLSAWAHEHAPDGTRRGEGARLELAQALYFKAAELLHGRPEGAAHEAGALASGGELALLRGDAATARLAATRGLRLCATPARTDEAHRRTAIRCGVLLLAAAGPELGEGAATDLVAEAVGDDRDLLRSILDARVAQVGAALDERPGDPHLLVAAGFYSLFTSSDVAIALARRQLAQAAASGFPLPELAYLQGRVAAAMGDDETAAAAWRRQQREFPEAAASRLAANDLAYQLATRGGKAEELAEALTGLDKWIERTPGEAALHETRGLLLERMGRRTEALASVERALALESSPERQAAATRLRARSVSP